MTTRMLNVRNLEKKDGSLKGGRRTSPNINAFGFSVVVKYTLRRVTSALAPALPDGTQSLIARIITHIAATILSVAIAIDHCASTAVPR
uniref:hypothetical protein n=1 Tax=Agrobacterium radiobacter TaxID=362 RepID=UPI00155D984A|nr:hypothetical protein [Agrobacterium radiobacter]